VSRLAQRVAHPVEPAVVIHQSPGIERLEVEGGIIQDSPGFGIRGLQNLKAPVQEEALDPVRPHSPPDSIRGLQDLKGYTGPMQGPGAAQANQAGTDD